MEGIASPRTKTGRAAGIFSFGIEIIHVVDVMRNEFIFVPGSIYTNNDNFVNSKKEEGKFVSG